MVRWWYILWYIIKHCISVLTSMFMFVFPWCACMDLNCFVTVILLACLYNACVAWLIDHFDSIEMLAVCDCSWFTILLNRHICKFLFARSDWFNVFHDNWITMLMLFLLIAMKFLLVCCVCQYVVAFCTILYVERLRSW